MAFAFPLQTKEEAIDHVRRLQKQYHDARHVCYAYTIGLDTPEERTNDDGEPSGTGGRPILAQIHSFGLSNTLICVVRYYGGTPLGAANLGRAYQAAAADALQQAQIKTCEQTSQFSLFARYEDIDLVMRIARKSNARISTTNHEAQGATLLIETRRSLAEQLQNELRLIHTLRWPRP